MLKLYEVVNNHFVELNSVIAQNFIRIVNVGGSRGELVPIIGMEFYNNATSRSELHLFRVDNITRSFAYTDEYFTLPPWFQIIPDQNHDEFPEFLVSDLVADDPLAIAVFKEEYLAAKPVGVYEQEHKVTNQLQLIGSRLYWPSTLNGDLIVSLYSMLGQCLSVSVVPSASEFVDLEQYLSDTRQPVVIVVQGSNQIVLTMLVQ
jgi:hypothetical protein